MGIRVDTLSRRLAPLSYSLRVKLPRVLLPRKLSKLVHHRFLRVHRECEAKTDGSGALLPPPDIDKQLLSVTASHLAVACPIQKSMSRFRPLLICRTASRKRRNV
jgi:hypothetical protein